MVKRRLVLRHQGTPQFRITPPGVDAETAPASACLLHESRAPLQITQTGVALWPGAGPLIVPIPQFAAEPLLMFYTVRAGNIWRYPAATVANGGNPPSPASPADVADVVLNPTSLDVTVYSTGAFNFVYLLGKE